MRRVLLLGVLVLGLGGCAAEQSEPAEGVFRALTYNVHGLPSGITGDDTTGRMEQIAPLLDSFEIVGLQEDFIDANHAILEESVGHPTRLRFAELLGDDRYYGSGLSIFAHVPEVTHRHVHYTACSGVFDGASDCLASKGFQLLRLRLAEGVELDLYNSHLEAGGGEADQEARAVHVEQLVESMTTESEGRAVLFLADTNLHRSDPTDLPLLERLEEEAGLSDACEEVGCSEPDHIDRLMFREAAGLSLEPLEWTNELDFFDSDGVPLSDHPALSAVFAWSSP